MIKKFFIVLGVIVLLATIFFIYVLSRKDKEKTPSLIAKPHFAQLTKIYDKKVFFPALSTDEKNILFYNNEDEAAFYKLSLDNKNIKKISQNLSTPEDVIWSPDRSKAILKVVYWKGYFEESKSPFTSPDIPNGTLTNWLYDFNTKKLKQLNHNIQSIAWLPNGEGIVYHFLDEEKNISNLSIANPDGSNWQNIITLKYDIGEGSYGLAFLDEKNLIYFTYPSAPADLAFYKLNLETKKITQLINKSPLGGGVLVSPNNQKICFEILHEEDMNYTLGVVDSDGKNKKDLKIKTSLQKSAWASDGQSLIAAVREENKTTDTFYKINITTGQKEEIKYKSETPIDATNLMLTKDGKTLYFTSDDYLYKLSF